MGGAIPLNIQVGSDGPTEEQRQVYLTFKEAEADLKAELQEALFEFYKSEREYTQTFMKTSVTILLR